MSIIDKPFDEIKKQKSLNVNCLVHSPMLNSSNDPFDLLTPNKNFENQLLEVNGEEAQEKMHDLLLIILYSMEFWITFITLIIGIGLKGFFVSYCF